MASLLSTPEEEQANTVAQQQPIVTSTSSGGGSTSGQIAGSPVSGSSSAAPQANAAQGSTSGPAPSASGQPLTTADINQIEQANANFDFSPIVNQLGTEGTTATNDINNAVNAWNTKVGTAPSFGSSDQAALDAVLGGTQPISTGQNMLSKSYTGPTNFDNSSYAPAVQKYQTDTGMTGSADSLSALLGQLEPSLTPGEQRFDSLAFSGNPAFRTASSGLINNANDIAAAGDDAVKTGNQNAADVAKGFNTYDTAGTGYVQAQRDAINQLLGTQLSSAQAAQKGVQNDFNDIQGGRATFGSVNPSDLVSGLSVPGNFTGAPTGLQTAPANVNDPALASIMAEITAAEKPVTPEGFAQFNAGTAPSLGSVATPDQITKYNNAENLLNETQRLQASPLVNPTIGLNSAGFNSATSAEQAAIQQLVSQYNAEVAAALARQQAVPAAPQGDGGINFIGGGVSAGAAAGTGPGGAGPGSAGPAGDGGAGPGGAAGAAGDGAGGGAGGDGGGGGGGDGGGFYRGGMIKAPGVKRNQPIKAITTPDAPDPIPQYYGSYQGGGYVPPNAGPPIQDGLLTRVNRGEEVIRQPSVNAVGKNNVEAINDADQMSPQRRTMLRDAITRTLHRAPMAQRG